MRSEHRVEPVGLRSLQHIQHEARVSRLLSERQTAGE
jgi:hypothetical protein